MFKTPTHLKFIYCFLYFYFALLSPASQAKPIIAVYPAWKHTASSATALPWMNFSHLAVSGVFPTENGLTSESVDAFIKELEGLCHQHNKKIILSIGGSGNSSKAFIAITKDENKIKNFVKSVADYAQKNNLDGIDIDWEYWTFQNELGKGGQDPIESERLLYLMKSLRLELPTKILLSVDVAPGSWLGDQYLVDLQKHVDYINLMAFDFTGAWKSSDIGYHSNLTLFKKAIEHSLNKGFDPQKLIIGLPAYGIEFVNGKTYQVNHVDYRDIVTQLGGNMKSLSKQKIGNLYFEDKESIAAKCQYINKKNLAGVFLFNVLSDHPSAEFSLLTACKNIL